jgi:hypothetical protein
VLRTRSRRAIRSITFAAFRRYGGSASIPLAKTPFIKNTPIKRLYHVKITYRSRQRI